MWLGKLCKNCSIRDKGLLDFHFIYVSNWCYIYHCFTPQVRLFLVGSKRFCSAASANSKVPIATLSRMKSNEARSTSFPIVPTALGEIDIELIAVAVELFSADRIKEKLLILVRTTL